MTREYSEAYAYEQQGRDAQPDYTPFIGLDGKTVFTKTRPMRCPWCRLTFYVPQPQDRPLPPHENPEPPLIDGKVKGMRSTCGHPKCWDIEQRHQMTRSDGHKSASENYYNTQQEPVAQNVTPKKGLKKLGATG